MKFMIIVKASQKSEQGDMPSEELISAMSKYNHELMKAEVLIDLNGLQSSAKGSRIIFSEGGKKSVVDGPFAETQELTAGYWIIKVGSKEEAIEWAKKAPFGIGIAGGEEAVLEIRQVFELDGFAPSPAIDEAKELGKQLAGHAG